MLTLPWYFVADAQLFSDIASGGKESRSVRSGENISKKGPRNRRSLRCASVEMIKGKGSCEPGDLFQHFSLWKGYLFPLSSRAQLSEGISAQDSAL